MSAEVELVPNCGGCNAKTAGGKGCADTWNRQQIGVGRTQRTYGTVIIEQRM